MRNKAKIGEQIAAERRDGRICVDIESGSRSKDGGGGLILKLCAPVFKHRFGRSFLGEMNEH